jgi:hypothetical protein
MVHRKGRLDFCTVANFGLAGFCLRSTCRSGQSVHGVLMIRCATSDQYRVTAQITVVVPLPIRNRCPFQLGACFESVVSMVRIVPPRRLAD